MTVLAYSLKLNVTDHHALLTEFKTFALAQGWTINLHEVAKQWASVGGGNYGFVAGAESYLELQSSGHGGQTLHFRLRMENSGATANHEWLQIGAFKAGATGRDTLSSVHPVQRASPGGVANWNTYRHTGVKPGLMEKVWFFGNSKFLMCVAQLDPTYCIFIAIGSVELIDAADDEGNFVGISGTSSSSTHHWFNKNQVIPFDNDGDCVLYDGAVKAAADFACNMIFNTSNGFSGSMFRYARGVQINSFSSKRPFRKPDVFVKHNSDSKWRLLGKYPIYRIDHTGLQIGQEMQYGAEKYIAFPMCRLNERYKGLAARIL